MKIYCVWEHNGNDSLIYAENCVGAYSRGKSREEALGKLNNEILSYHNWLGEHIQGVIDTPIVQEKSSELKISDADSDVLFYSEELPLSRDEYDRLKALALKSAGDFLKLYNAIPDKDKSGLPRRQSFYGQVPRTAREMYEHTRNVNAYYFGEIGVEADNEGNILECRRRGFELLEQQPDFLKNSVFDGSYGELWTLRKLLRRFIWHDRIHAKAMYRMAMKTFPGKETPNIFKFII